MFKWSDYRERRRPSFNLTSLGGNTAHSQLCFFDFIFFNLLLFGAKLQWKPAFCQLVEPDNSNIVMKDKWIRALKLCVFHLSVILRLNKTEMLNFMSQFEIVVKFLPHNTLFPVIWATTSHQNSFSAP